MAWPTKSNTGDATADAFLNNIISGNGDTKEVNWAEARGIWRK